MVLIDTQRWPLMPVNLLFCVYKRLTTWGKYWSMYSVCLSSLSHVNFFLHRLNYIYSNRMETTYGDIQYVKVKEKMLKMSKAKPVTSTYIISFPLISFIHSYSYIINSEVSSWYQCHCMTLIEIHQMNDCFIIYTQLHYFKISIILDWVPWNHSPVKFIFIWFRFLQLHALIDMY